MENIRKLREEWTCKKSGSACGSTYCFVDPETNTHIPLSHEHFDAWGMAMVRSWRFAFKIQILSQSRSDEPKRLSHATSTTKQQIIWPFPNRSHISHCTTSKGRTSCKCIIIILYWSTRFQYISWQWLRKPLSSCSPTGTCTSPSPSSSITSACNHTNIFKLASAIPRARNRHGSLRVLHPVRSQQWNSCQAHKKWLHTYPNLALCPD